MHNRGFLDLIYSFVLGFAMAIVLGVVQNAFYPLQMESQGGCVSLPSAGWAMFTDLGLLACAAAALTLSLVLRRTQLLIANGFFAFGTVVLIYANVIAAASYSLELRVCVAIAAVALWVAFGWLHFINRDSAGRAPHDPVIPPLPRPDLA